MNRLVSWVLMNDNYVFQYVNQHLKCRVLDYLLPKITHLGGATFTISSMLFLLILGDSILKGWVLQALLSLTFSHIIVHFIKKAYCRKRPYNTLSNVQLSAHPLKDYSFPSGHTTAIFSIVMIFSIHSLFLAVLFIPIAILVGLSRMYVGLHYPTDVIIGALIGTVSSIIVISVSRFF